MITIFRNKNPSPPFEVVKQCLPCLAQLIQHQDREVCLCRVPNKLFVVFVALVDLLDEFVCAQWQILTSFGRSWPMLAGLCPT